jgi:uncharacterized membrane protein YbhN (UPF0104 family)
MSSRRVFSLVAALAATLIVGYFVVSQLTWRDLTALLAASDLKFLTLGFVAYLCANVLRAARFRALTGDQIPTAALLRTVIAQNLLNTFLPLRAGEASYLYMVHRTGAVKPGDNIGSLLGARVLDLLAAVLIPVSILPLSRAWSAEDLPFGALVAALAVGVLVLALAIRNAEPLGNVIAARATTGRAWLDRALLVASDTLRSLARLRSSRLLGRVTLLTASCWLLIYVSGYLSLLGLGLELRFFDSVFAYSFPVVISMMPFFMLGGFGVYEGSIGLGLNLVGVPLGQCSSCCRRR